MRGPGASLERGRRSRIPDGFQRRRGQDPLWYKDAVIYETHVKSFYDSNGDGIGDLRGLVEKLDYLQDLGINCLWLLPLFRPR